MSEQRHRRGKAIAWSSAALGLGVIAVAVICYAERFVEEWHLYRLRSGDAREREDAAEKLTEMSSVRAIPVMLRELGATVQTQAADTKAHAFSSGWQTTDVLPPTEPLVTVELHYEDGMTGGETKAERAVVLPLSMPEGCRRLVSRLVRIARSSGEAAMPALQKGMQLDSIYDICRVLGEIAAGKADMILWQSSTARSPSSVFLR